MRFSRAKVLATAAAALLVATAAVLAVHQGLGGGGSRSDPPTVDPHGYQMWQADAAGSVVLDTGSLSPAVIGVDSAGRRVWTEPLAKRRLPLISDCLAVCPDVAISGNVEADPTTPDPPVIWRTASGRTEESSDYDGRPGKKRVIVAVSPDVAIVQEADLTGRARLELRDRPKASLDIPLPATAATSPVLADVSADFDTVVATFSDPINNQLMVDWFARDRNGWHTTSSSSVSGDEHFGCLSPTGKFAILFGDQTLRVAAGSPVQERLPLPGENCYFNAAGMVVADYGRKVVTQYDPTNQPRWTARMPPTDGLAVVTTDRAGAYVVLGAQTESQVISPQGSVVADLPHGFWAIAASAHSYTYLDESGTVHRGSLS